MHYHRCDKPWEVCFLLDDLGDKSVERKRARRISLIEAAEVLKKADEHGLVHMTLYQPGRKIYALCSCCPCCCHDLQLLRQYHRTDLVARSDYIAMTDREQCTDCGKCVERCAFGARELQGGTLHYDPGTCLGCGLCVSVCPVNATVMQVRQTET
jgi:NAD-dependent dihydropyrimidine dehydrogenase PreA subunit